MSLKKKYGEGVLIFLAVYLFSYLFRLVGELIFIYSHTYLCEMLPSVVKAVNPIHSPVEYEAYLRTMTLVSAFISLFTMHYVALRLENVKFEFIISKTDGQYGLADGLKLYFGNFILSDVITAGIVGVFILGAAFIPDKWMDLGLVLLFGLGEDLTECFGVIESVMIGVGLSVAARILCIPLLLRSFRANWLSGSI